MIMLYPQPKQATWTSTYLDYGTGDTTGSEWNYSTNWTIYVTPTMLTEEIFIELKKLRKPTIKAIIKPATQRLKTANRIKLNPKQTPIRRLQQGRRNETRIRIPKECNEGTS
jgi:hypothetical protein